MQINNNLNNPLFPEIVNKRHQAARVDRIEHSPIPPPPIVNRQLLETALNFKLNPKVDVDLKTLTMVVGDSFINDTSLEGGSPKSALGYLINFWSLFPQAVRTPLNEIIEFYKFQSQIEEKEKDDDKRLELYSEWLSNKVKNTNSCTFVGGYIGSSQGAEAHAVIYEVFCEEEEEFGTIRVYQQGAGIEYHTIQDLNYMRRRGAYYEKKQIPREILTNPILFIAILGPFLIDHDAKHPWTGDIIYDYIAGVLPGVEVAADTYIKEMDSGLCYFKCFLSLIKTYMNEEEYNSFILRLKICTFLQFEDNYVLTSDAETSVKARFLADLAEKIQRSLKDHREVNTAPKHVLDLINDYLEESNQKFRNLSNHPIHQLPLPLDPKQTELPTTKLLEIYDKRKDISDTPFNLNDGRGAELPLELIFNRVETADEIIWVLYRIQKHFFETTERGEKLNALYSVALALSQLPSISKAKSSTWGTLSREQSMQVLGQIHWLMNRLIQAGLKVDLENKEEYKTIQCTIIDWLYVVASELGARIFKSKSQNSGILIGSEKQIPVVGIKYKTPSAITDDNLNRETPFVPGVVSKLLEDVYLRNTENATAGLYMELCENEDHIIELHDDELELYDFMMRAAERDGVDLKDLNKQWANGNYLLRLFEIKENQPELNALAHLIQINLMFDTDNPWDHPVKGFDEPQQKRNSKGFFCGSII